MSLNSVPTLSHHADSHNNILVTLNGNQLKYLGNDYGSFSGQLYFVTEEEARKGLVELSRRLQIKIAQGQGVMKLKELFIPAITTLTHSEKKFG